MLVDKGWKPWEIGRVTTRFLNQFVFVPRDEYGAIIPPTKGLTQAEIHARREPPASLEDHLARLEAAHQAVIEQNKRGLDNYEEAAEAIRVLWASGEAERRRHEWEQSEAVRGVSVSGQSD